MKILEEIKEKKNNLTDKQLERIFIGIIILITVITVFFILQPSQNQDISDTKIEWENVEINESTQHPSIVPKEEKPELTITYYGDFSCPHCKTFEQKVFGKIINNHVATGNAKFVFKPLDLLGRESTSAANAAYYVWNNNPQEYWDWHKNTFDNQSGTTQWTNPENLQKYGEIKNPQKFQTSVNTQKYRTTLDNNEQDAKDSGIQGTPGLVVGDSITGGTNYKKINQTINEELP